MVCYLTLVLLRALFLAFLVALAAKHGERRFDMDGLQTVIVVGSHQVTMQQRFVVEYDVRMMLTVLFQSACNLINARWAVAICAPSIMKRAGEAEGTEDGRNVAIGPPGARHDNDGARFGTETIKPLDGVAIEGPARPTDDCSTRSHLARSDGCWSPASPTCRATRVQDAINVEEDDGVERSVKRPLPTPPDTLGGIRGVTREGCREMSRGVRTMSRAGVGNRVARCREDVARSHSAAFLSPG